MSEQYIYALHAGDEVPFYCGRTHDPKERLRSHLRSANPSGTKKERLIAKLFDAGIPVEMMILEKGAGANMVGKEDSWKTNLEGEGYLLVNSKAGDSDYMPIPTLDREPVGWSVDPFKEAAWSADHMGCKAGERGCWINGVSFFRVGNRKLRFIHPQYGTWDVQASTMDKKFERACQMLTVGTEHNERLVEQVAQTRTLKSK